MLLTTLEQAWQCIAYSEEDKIYLHACHVILRQAQLAMPHAATHQGTGQSTCTFKVLSWLPGTCLMADYMTFPHRASSSINLVSFGLCNMNKLISVIILLSLQLLKARCQARPIHSVDYSAMLVKADVSCQARLIR